MNYEISWLAKQFSKNNTYSQISINDTNVELMHPYLISVVLNLDSLDLKIKSGIFWDTLLLHTSDFEYQFGGLPASICEQIYHQTLLKKHTLNKFKQTIRNKLDNLSSLLFSQFQQVVEFNQTKRYIRHTEVESWIKKTLPNFEFLTQANQLEILSADESAWHHALSPFIELGQAHFNELNNQFVQNEILRFKQFFDSIESQPLTQAQRKASVTNEQFNLVLAGAGTGKTSTMVARTGYLLQAQLVKPEHVLMLAFASKAAEEMQERVEKRLKTSALNVKTFHSLGLAILSQVDGKVPDIHPMAEDASLKERFIDNEIQRLLRTEKYTSSLVDYFFYHHLPYKSQYEFKSLGEYTQYILENEIITLQGEKVKSFEECEIANFLYRNGIAYQYEAKYKVDTRDQNHKQYQPDFYLIEEDIYIEHFAVDIDGKTPPFIKQQTYIDGMEWKRKLHEKHQTTLIETFSYLKQQGRLTEYLAEKLQEKGVQFQPLAQDKLLENLRDKGLVSQFSKLIAQILSLFKLSGGENLLSNHAASPSAQAIQTLFEPIFNAYQNELIKTSSIDFDDMILKATQYVNEGLYISPFLHILVDEFQDISVSRANLIRALLSQQQDATLFCVGDDWQSIYRFTGSDIGLTSHFEQAFGHAATNVLDKTFRFNNKINEVAARFIQQNPNQLKKEIVCHHQTTNEAVSIIKTNDMENGIKAALNGIQLQTNNKGVTVLVLGRFSHSKPEIKRLRTEFPQMQLGFMTVHGSKGKEADFVIITDLTKGKHGFPAEKNNHPLLESLLAQGENYRHAEERRLFYVALTRAREHVYLLTHPHRTSDFVRELIDNLYPVILLNETYTTINADNFLPNTPCPACRTGYLIPRDGHSSFLGCTHYPYCDYTQQACQWCGGETYLEGAFLRCRSKSCDYKAPKCPKCVTGILKIKPSNGTKFWGCSNYRKDAEFSCTYTTNFVDLNH
ncbi:MAG: UvrD-helicase domain-containing protein [Methylophilus sp.]|nr:UvrD-helicase domain-containing protein [Methylophilus sp.]